MPVPADDDVRGPGDINRGHGEAFVKSYIEWAKEMAGDAQSVLRHPEYRVAPKSGSQVDSQRPLAVALKDNPSPGRRGGSHQPPSEPGPAPCDSPSDVLPGDSDSLLGLTSTPELRDRVKRCGNEDGSRYALARGSHMGQHDSHQEKRDSRIRCSGWWQVLRSSSGSSPTRLRPSCTCFRPRSCALVSFLSLSRVLQVALLGV